MFEGIFNQAFDEGYVKEYAGGRILVMLEFAFEGKITAKQMASELGIPLEHVTELLEVFNKCTEQTVQNCKITEYIDFGKVHELRRMKEDMEKHELDVVDSE